MPLGLKSPNFNRNLLPFTFKGSKDNNRLYNCDGNYLAMVIDKRTIAMSVIVASIYFTIRCSCQTHTMLEMLVVGCMLLLEPGAMAHETKIILDEDSILGTCLRNCDMVPELYNKCDKLSSCRLISIGWTRGFACCDFCSCMCTTADDYRDACLQTY